MSIIIENTRDVINVLRRKTQELIREYNRILLNKYGIYLKPVHIISRRYGKKKIKYVYFGRYFWLVKDKRVLGWRYLRKYNVIGIPEPPKHKLFSISLKLENEHIVINDKRTLIIIRSICSEYGVDVHVREVL